MNGTVPASTLIISHPNTDFDAFGSTLAAQLLYPGSVVCLQGGANRNVREFFNLHADEIPHVEPSAVDPKTVRRAILVEVSATDRLGSLRPVVDEDQVEVTVFDHHPGAQERIGERSVIGSDGALVTTMLKLLAASDIDFSVMHATAFALGIHEDTGSLTFPSTTDRDAEALAYCLRAGANQEMLARYLRTPLTDEQRELLVELDRNREVREIEGLTIVATSAQLDRYVEDVSGLAPRVGEVADWDALFLCVAMVGRTFVVGRSRSDGLRADEVLRPLGGGGHPQAASAIVRQTDAKRVLRKLLKEVKAAVRPPLTAGDIMSKPVHTVSSDSSVVDSLVELQRLGQSGIQVKEADELVGLVLREDLDRAVRHGLGHAPAKAVMSAGVPVVGPSMPFSELRAVLATGRADRVLVVGDGHYRVLDRVSQRKTAGVVTRGDVLRAMHELGVRHALTPDEKASADLRPRLEQIPRLAAILPAVQRIASTYKGVYLVGGAVRDVLIGEMSLDLDLMVEGDAIGFASELARQLDGHAHPHDKFQTAVIKGRFKDGSELRVDVAAARTEFYDAPGAQPRIEQSSLREDLARRDFTINAMAASLKPEDLGAVHDFFGGYRDLQSGTLRVLHNLSFVEDPTRMFRGLRYEARLGFRMDRRTNSLARGCVEMRLVGDLASERVRDELLALLAVDRVGYVLARMEELGIDKAIHPGLDCDAEAVALIERVDVLLASAGWGSETRRDLARLACLLRRSTPEQIYPWLESLKMRREEQEVVAGAASMSYRLCSVLDSESLTPSELYKSLSGQSVETLVVCAALAGSASTVEKNVRLWLDELRHVQLEIDGKDLIEAGVSESPVIGKALDETLRLKLDGSVSGHDDELKTALAFAER